jgi:hypothetical protein
METDNWGCQSAMDLSPLRVERLDDPLILRAFPRIDPPRRDDRSCRFAVPGTMDEAPRASR